MVKGNKPAPDSNVEGEGQPDTGLIVRKRNGRWLDEAGTDWSGAVPFDLPDLDVYAINAMAPVPGVTRRVGGVGTVLFNLAVNPVSGELYVSNLEALNHVRFEGPGETATTVRGHIAESRISVVSDSGCARGRGGPEVRSEAMMAGNVLTFSCVPPGSGERLALDR